MSVSTANPQELNLERPSSIPISPSSSITSLHYMNGCRADEDVGAETDSGPTQEGCSDYLSEDSRIAALMAEYAEKDEDYEGGATEDGGPPRPMLIPTSIGDPHETSKDGPGKIVKKIKKTFRALRIKKGERNLSLATNQPSPAGADGITCLYIYHHSGSPSPGMSLLVLNPDQSPRLSPQYTPDNVTFGEVISYLPAGKDTPAQHTPGTDVVKLESKTHVYLALDYTDEENPKLLAIEEKAMENILMTINEGRTDQKLKPVVNVRTFPGPTNTENDTAFYFKTEKNYHFVTVNEKTLRLEVKSIPVAKKTKYTYREYLSFGPQPQKSCPRIPEEAVDTARPTKTTIPTSPMSDLGTDKTDSERSKKSSTSSSCGSSPSDGKFKFEGVARDSGVDVGSKDEVDTGPAN